MRTHRSTAKAAQTEIERLAALIGIDREELPSYSGVPGPDLMVVIVGESGFHLDYNDSGREIVRHSFATLDGLLYELFRGYTFSRASEWELANRVRGQDTRRLLFQRQEDLIGQLSTVWAQRLHHDHATILASHPFDDVLAQRAARWQELINRGLTREEAVSQAERERPYPGRGAENEDRSKGT